MRTKQRMAHEDFLEIYERSTDMVSEKTIDVLVAAAGVDIAHRFEDKRIAYGWSGGKDSVALQYVVEQLLGPETPCVWARTELEFPTFESWVREHAPQKLITISNGWGWEWLAKHQHYLFPKDHKASSRWFRGVQWNIQDSFIEHSGADVLLLGRTRADGNNIPADGFSRTATTLKYSPLRDWSHAQIFALIRYKNLPLAPLYQWPRGFVVGTGPWAKRRVESDTQGWEETYAINPDLVRQGATFELRGAAEFLESR